MHLFLHLKAHQAGKNNAVFLCHSAKKCTTDSGHEKTNIPCNPAYEMLYTKLFVVIEMFL